MPEIVPVHIPARRPKLLDAAWPTGIESSITPVVALAFASARDQATQHDRDEAPNPTPHRAALAFAFASACAARLKYSIRVYRINALIDNTLNGLHPANAGGVGL